MNSLYKIISAYFPHLGSNTILSRGFIVFSGWISLLFPELLGGYESRFGTGFPKCSLSTGLSNGQPVLFFFLISFKQEYLYEYITQNKRAKNIVLYKKIIVLL